MNEELRRYAKTRGVTLWRIAQKMNISEPTITRRLRVELNESDRTAFIDAVNAVVREREEASGT